MVGAFAVRDAPSRLPPWRSWFAESRVRVRGCAGAATGDRGFTLLTASGVLKEARKWSRFSPAAPASPIASYDPGEAVLSLGGIYEH